MTPRSSIHFERGSRSATVEGEVSADSPDNWHIGAKAGQLMTVELLDAQASATFSVSSPLKKDKTSEPLAVEVRQWGGRLPASGDYTIRVSAGEKGSRYRLKVTLSNVKTLSR